VHVQRDTFLILFQHCDRQTEADDSEIQQVRDSPPTVDPPALAAALIAMRPAARPRVAWLLSSRRWHPRRGRQNPACMCRPIRRCPLVIDKRAYPGPGTSSASHKIRGRNRALSRAPARRPVSFRPRAASPDCPTNFTPLLSKSTCARRKRCARPAPFQTLSRPSRSRRTKRGCRQDDPSIHGCWSICHSALRMKLTPLTAERHPAQRVAVGRRDIYGAAVVQAI